MATSPGRGDRPRVPFGSLVERGLVAPGSLLTDRARRVEAVVVADGSIRVGELQGSIHKMGAAVQNTPTCNGWTFWHFELDGRLQAIDTLRILAQAVPDIV
jgi:modification methylase